MQHLDVSKTGHQGGVNAEEEAFQKIMSSLNACDYPPVLYAGKRQFSVLVEIVSSLQAMLNRDQRRALKASAEKCGFMVVTASQETIATASRIAWNVEEKRFPIVRSLRLEPDQVVVAPQPLAVQKLLKP